MDENGRRLSGLGVVLPLLLWPVGLRIGLQRQPAEIASLWWFVG
ncbi:hypothetical protein ABID81_002347 [Frigoribacterium sp. PvP054]